MEQMPNLYKEMTEFAVRVMHGDGKPEEIAILPEVLKVITQQDRITDMVAQLRKDMDRQSLFASPFMTPKTPL